MHNIRPIELNNQIAWSFFCIAKDDDESMNKAPANHEIDQITRQSEIDLILIICAEASHQANSFLSGRRVRYCGRHQTDTDRGLASREMKEIGYQ